MSPALSLPLRLARRELRTGLKGFRIFLACLALGVAAIAAVGSVSSAMMAGLEGDARRLLGGDVDLRLTHQEASDEQRAYLAGVRNAVRGGGDAGDGPARRRRGNARWSS